MRKTLFTTIAIAGLLAAGFASANVLERLDPWRGWVSRINPDVEVSSQWKKVEVFQDRNGCQYLVATGGSGYNYGAYGISITPRINSATAQPLCIK